MAKSPSGETKTPVIIALVFFVLATLTLGALLYMAYDEKAQMTASVADAEKKATEAGKLRTTEQEKTMLYKGLLGIASTEEFETLKNATSGPALKAEYDKAMTEVQTRLGAVVNAAQQQAVADRKAAGLPDTAVIRVAVSPDQVVRWPWAGDKPDAPPQVSMLQGLVATVAAQQIAAARQANSDELAKAALEDYNAKAKQADAAKDDFAKKAAEFPALVKKIQDEANAEVKKIRDEYAVLTTAFTKKLKEMTETINSKDIQLGEVRAKADSAKELVTKLEGQISAREDPFAFDKPHGRITRRDGNMVSINLGSTANVRPGLTFSVFPSNTPEVGMQSRMRPRIGPTGRPVTENDKPVMEIVSKGTIEVTEVLGSNTSLARITGQSDQIRDAILVGDVLYNSAWRPGSADHIALFGLFDIDGDGIDDIKQVVRDLSNMGIVVDAYFDLEQKKWVGRVTERTIYAVEGYYPDTTGDATLAAAKGTIYTALQAARQEAREKGSRIVKTRDFFPRVGYRVRLDVPQDRINQAYLKYLQTAPVSNDTAIPVPGM